MNLNFWQWLGVILLIIGAFVMFRDRFADKGKVDQPATQMAK